MRSFKDFINEQVSQEYLESKNVYVDENSSKWSMSSSILSYMKKRGYSNPVGVFDFNKTSNSDSILFELDSFDKKWIREVGLKENTNEIILRFATESHVVGGSIGLVKVNPVKGMVYFLEDSEDENNQKFESRGLKIKYARFLHSFLKKHLNFV